MSQYKHSEESIDKKRLQKVTIDSLVCVDQNAEAHTQQHGLSRSALFDDQANAERACNLIS